MNPGNLEVRMKSVTWKEGGHLRGWWETWTRPEQRPYHRKSCQHSQKLIKNSGERQIKAGGGCGRRRMRTHRN